VPKVFLCHSSADKVFVRKLADDLRAKNLSVWIDEKEILVGDPIRQKIEEGLKASDYLAIVLSPSSVSSAWVQKELDTKLIEEIESRRVVVLPVYHQQCDIPGFLTGKHYADFRTDYDSGLDELLARFQQGNREEEVKRNVILRLSGIDIARLDPHLLLQLAVNASQFEAAEDLAKAHEATHPNCPHVQPARMVMAVARHEREKTPASWVAASSIMFEFLKKNPHQNNFKTLDELVKRIPRDRDCLAHVQGTLRECLSALKGGNRAWAQQCAAGMLKALERLPLNPSEAAEACGGAAQIIETVDSDGLRQSLSALVHIGTHLANKFLKSPERETTLQRIVNCSAEKTKTSHEFSDAFLHLAWAQALLGETAEAKNWLNKYRLTVPAQTFSQQIGKHPPLAELAKELS
jgi:hypothetical protein